MGDTNVSLPDDDQLWSSAPPVKPLPTPGALPVSHKDTQILQPMLSTDGKYIAVTSPEGDTGALPQENLHDALGKGFKIGIPSTYQTKFTQQGFEAAVHAISPEGDPGLLPTRNATRIAVERGFLLGSGNRPPVIGNLPTSPIPTRQAEAAAMEPVENLTTGPTMQDQLGKLGQFSAQQAAYGREEAQRNLDKAYGPGSENLDPRARLGYHAISLADEAAAAAHGVIAGVASDPKAQVAMIAGVADPAIPVAYFGAQGAAGLLGLGGRESSVKRAIKDPSPENTQAALFDAAMMFGAAEQGAKGFRAEAPPAGVAAQAPPPAATGSAARLLGRAVEPATAPVASFLRKYYDPAALTATEAATKAFRPRNAKANWQAEIASALPDMRRSADKLGIDVNNLTLDDTLRLAQDAATDKWAEYKRNYLGPNADVTINTQPVADQIRSTITDAMREQNPRLARRIESVAATFDDREMPLDEVQRRVSALNNQTRAIEARYLTDKRAAKLSPNAAYIFAQRDSLRSVLDDKLNELSGPGAPELRKSFGALRSVEDVISRRIPVADRAAREPLAAMLAKAYGAANIVGGVLAGHPLGVLKGVAAIAAERRARALQDPDYLAQLALRKTQPTPPWEPRTPEGPKPAPPGWPHTGPYPMPASPLAPQSQLPAGTPPPIEGEYLSEPAPRPPAALPAGPSPLGVTRQLPGIRMPQRAPAISPTAEVVGMPEAEEFTARQRLAERRAQEAQQAAPPTQPPTLGTRGAPEPANAPQGASEELVPSFAGGEGDLEARQLQPGLYSKAEQVTETKLPNVATGNAMLATLRNNGVKPAEIADLMLEQFLTGDMRGSQKFTRQQVLDHIRANQLQVVDITHGAVLPQLRAQREAAYVEQNRLAEEVRDSQRSGFVGLDWFYEDAQHRAALSEELQRRDPELLAKLQRIDDLGRIMDDLDAKLERVRELPTKHDTWTEHGGTNYREILFTVPDYGRPSPGIDVGQHFGGFTMRPSAQVPGTFDVVGPDGRLVMGNLDQEMAERVIDIRDPRARARRSIQDDEEDFGIPKHGHWNERQVMGHMRLSDHIDSDGKRVLFGEEFQTDPGQKFRDLQEKIDKGEDLSIAERADYRRIQNLPDYILRNPHEYMLKRFLRYAAENGYDRVAWTTGMQQATRYKDWLLKNVDSIEWNENQDGTFGYTAYKYDRRVANQDHLSASELADHLGKDMAAKIISKHEGEAGVSQESQARGGVNDMTKAFGSLKDLDMVIGGEGMKTFYDRMIPQFLNKYVKKFGGKVGTTEINTTGRLRYNVIDSDGQLWDAFPNRERAEATVQQMNANPEMHQIGGTGKWRVQVAGAEVHSLDITPEMKAQFMGEGQPLYSMHQPSDARVGDLVGSARKMNPEIVPGGGDQAAFIRLDDSTRRFLGAMGAGKEWVGVNWDLEGATKRLQLLRNVADQIEQIRPTSGGPEAAANIRKLADQMGQVIEANRDPGAGHAGVSLVHNPSAQAHETEIHGGQRAFDVSGAGDIGRFTNIEKTAAHQAVKIARPVLLMAGVPNQPHFLVAELQAHILDGSAIALGLTPEQAVDFIRHSRQVLQEHHGAELIANPPRLARRYVRALYEFTGERYEPTTGTGPEAAPPYPGGAGAEPAGNAGAGELARSGIRAEDAGAAQEEPAQGLEARLLEARGRRKERSLEFVSPNIFTDLSAEQAGVRMRSMTHQASVDFSRELNQAFGLKSDVQSAFGTWKDGAEDSIFIDTPDAPDPATRQYLAAIKGRMNHQKSVAWFHIGEGPDSLYTFTVPIKTKGMTANIRPSTRIADIARNLSDEGLGGHTIIPVTGGHTVVIIDQGRKLADNVLRAADRFNVPSVRQEAGTGGEIGGGTREEARAIFDRVIEDYERANPAASEIRRGAEEGRSGNTLRQSLARVERIGQPVLETEHASPLGTLETLKPEMQGTNALLPKGAEWKRTSQYPETPQRSYSHVKGAPGWERQYQRLPYRYTAELPPENIYDLAADPEGLRQGAQAEAARRGEPHNNALITSLYERAIKRAGYEGYRAPGEDVATFQNVPLKANFLSDLKDLLPPRAMRELEAPSAQTRFREVYDKINLGALKEAAQRGISQIHWYRRSATLYDALNEAAPELFPAEERGRFMSFVAALSPRQLVSKNLEMAIDPWVRWIEGGKQIDLATLRKRKGVGLRDVELKARMMNAHRALMKEDLSGFKVADFSESTVGKIDEAVIDGIMNLFGGLDLKLDDPAAYYAFSTRVKEAARDLKLQPGEAQAAIWGWTQTFLKNYFAGRRQPRAGLDPKTVAESIQPADVAESGRSGDFLDIARSHEGVRRKLASHLGEDGLQALDQALERYDRATPRPQGTRLPKPKHLGLVGEMIAKGATKRLETGEWGENDLESRPLKPVPRYLQAGR